MPVSKGAHSASGVIAEAGRFTPSLVESEGPHWRTVPLEAHVY